MDTPNDGNLNSAGEQEQSTSAASQSASQLSQDDIKALVHRLDETEKQLKGLQKGTDKQIANVRDDVKRILELKESGLNDKQIERELMIDQLLGRSASPAPVAPTPQPAGNAIDVETVVKAMQFDENDVAVAAVKKAYANDPQTLISQLAQLKITQAKQTSSPATALPPVGGTGGGQQSVDSLTKEYQSKMIAAQGNPTLARLLKEDYKKKGVPVDAVVFV